MKLTMFLGFCIESPLYLGEPIGSDSQVSCDTQVSGIPLRDEDIFTVNDSYN